MALTWNDIDFTNQTLSVNKTLAEGLNHRQFIDTPKTRSSIRTISVDSKTLEVLKEWRTQQRVLSLKHGHNTSSKHQEIFTNVETNKRLNRVYANETLNLICKKNNFKRITVHGFRHTHCSLLFEAGLSVQEVQDRLGHGIYKRQWEYMHTLLKSSVRKWPKSSQIMLVLIITYSKRIQFILSRVVNLFISTFTTLFSLNQLFPLYSYRVSSIYLP